MVESVYPLDFDSSSPDEGQSVFRKVNFVSWNSEPPIRPSRGKTDDPTFVLEDHVYHFVKCARLGSVPLQIVLPYQPSQDGRWARYQSDIARTLLDGVERWLLRGPIERTVGPAPFQVLVLLVGAQNDLITTFFSQTVLVSLLSGTLETLEEKNRGD